MLPHNRRLSTSFIWWILICKSWFNLALNVDVITVGYLNLILMLFRRIAIDFIINIAPVLSKLIFFHLISFNLEKFHNFTSEYNYNCVFINIFIKKYNFIPMPPNGIMKKDAKSMYYCCLNLTRNVITKNYLTINHYHCRTAKFSPFVNTILVQVYDFCTPAFWRTGIS